MDRDEPKVALVAEHASIDFGGEAALPCHYFRGLLERNIDVHLFVHERSLPFLRKTFPANLDRVHVVPDTWIHRLLFKLQKPLPARVSYFTVGYVLRLLTQSQHRRAIKRMIARGELNLVHQVIPVSPREPSLLYGLNAPVVIGPMNGGMQFPPAFHSEEGLGSRIFASVGRHCSNQLNALVPGKRRADLIWVANQRTEQALPSKLAGRVEQLVENGVDLSVWSSPNMAPSPATARAMAAKSAGTASFAFVGRLVKLKAVDLLLEAFAMAARESAIVLHIVGDGPESEALQNQSNTILREELQAGSQIQFHGWQPQSTISDLLADATALVMPSLHECGGAVVLEAMACSRAVIATNWGGPADYVDDTCGILVDPASPQSMVEGFAAAMAQLANEPGLAFSLGAKGRMKVEQQFDWDQKIEYVLDAYSRLVERHSDLRSRK